MTTIINVSNHNLTAAQTTGVDQVVELPDTIKKDWGALTPDKINGVVEDVIAFIQDTNAKVDGDVFIHVAGHASAVASILETIDSGWCIYAFTTRNSVDEPQADGTIKKTFVFDFQGWFRYKDNSKVEF